MSCKFFILKSLIFSDVVRVNIEGTKIFTWQIRVNYLITPLISNGYSIIQRYWPHKYILTMAVMPTQVVPTSERLALAHSLTTGSTSVHRHIIGCYDKHQLVACARITAHNFDTDLSHPW